MSHFTVLVLTDENTTVSELLEPYSEHIRVAPYKVYTKEQLIEKTRKDLEEYKNTRYAKFLSNPEEYKDKHKDNLAHLEYVEFEFPKKLNFSDEEVYADAIRFYEPEEIASDGSIISTYNPKSKWDWYVEGGRWSCELKLKEREDGGGEVWVDSAKASEIDFSRNEEDYNSALRSWDLVVEGVEPENEDEEMIVRFGDKEKYLKVYGTKENFANINASFRTYAVVTPDGVWHEPGEMGWWGISHATNEDEEIWWSEYPKFIRMAIENDWIMTVIDCHI